MTYMPAWIAFGFFLATFLVGGTVSAQTDTLDIAQSAAAAPLEWFETEQISGNIEVGDFVVGPGRTEVAIQPGQTVTKEITITNRISDNRTFKLDVQDITGLADGSKAVTVLEGERGPYSLKDYISFPDDTISLDLGERARVPVTISIPADAEPAGFYGSVLVSTVRDPGSADPVAPRSPIIARVGSLFLVTVPGDIERAGETKALSVIDNDRWWFEKGPIGLALLYENTGSVHLNPYGQIEVTNMLGEEVGFIELEPWFVLPQSLRSREIVWDREFLLGRYTVEAKINRGYDDIIDTQTVTFWVLPWKFIVAVLVGVFLVVFLIKLFFSRFEFKRKQ